MRWPRVLPLLLVVAPAWGGEDYVIGAGIESDSDDGLAAAGFVDVGLSEKTRVSVLLGKNTSELPRGVDLDTVYGDLGLDYFFNPIGIRTEVAYWGDQDIFDSKDWRGSLYWQNDKVTISGNLEYRGFEFEIFRDDAVAGQDVRFHAKGYGVSTSFELGDRVSLSLGAIDYDYNVNLRLDANRRIVQFLSVSRLSLINSLVDYRASAGISVDVGDKVWSLSYATTKGEVDQSVTHSGTLRFLAPVGRSTDLELGIGIDDSDTYGSVTFLSGFLYFYGG